MPGLQADIFEKRKDKTEKRAGGIEKRENEKRGKIGKPKGTK